MHGYMGTLSDYAYNFIADIFPVKQNYSVCESQSALAIKCILSDFIRALHASRKTQVGAGTEAGAGAGAGSAASHHVTPKKCSDEASPRLSYARVSLISLDTRAVVCHGESEIDNAVESAEIRHLKRRYCGTGVLRYWGAAVRVAVRPCYLREYHLHKTHTLCRIVPGHVFVFVSVFARVLAAANGA